MQHASGIKHTELKKMVDMLQVSAYTLPFSQNNSIKLLKLTNHKEDLEVLVLSVWYRTLSQPDSRRCTWSISPGTSQPPITWWSPSWRANCWRGWVERRVKRGFQVDVEKTLNRAHKRALRCAKMFTILTNEHKKRFKEAWSNYVHLERCMSSGINSPKAKKVWRTLMMLS